MLMRKVETGRGVDCCRCREMAFKTICWHKRNCDRSATNDKRWRRNIGLGKTHCNRVLSRTQLNSTSSHIIVTLRGCDCRLLGYVHITYSNQPPTYRIDWASRDPIKSFRECSFSPWDVLWIDAFGWLPAPPEINVYVIVIHIAFDIRLYVVMSMYIMCSWGVIYLYGLLGWSRCR